MPSGRGVSGTVVVPEGNKVLSTLAGLGVAGADKMPSHARVLVGSASLLASAGVKLSADVEAHMVSVQVQPRLRLFRPERAVNQHYVRNGCKPCSSLDGAHHSSDL